MTNMITSGSAAIRPYFFDDDATFGLKVRDDGNLALKAEPADSDPFSAEAFIRFFTTPTEQFTLQLQNATLTDVLRRYADYNRNTSPGYTNSAVISFIQDIELRCGGLPLMPNRVNGLFYQKMQGWLIEQRGLKPSTVESYFHQISAALNWGKDYGVTLAPGYNKFDVPHYEGARYALTFEEVCTIYNFDPRQLMKEKIRIVKAKIEVETECHRNGKTYRRKVEKTGETEIVVKVPRFREEHLQKLERVRDMFVLCCMLMQRYSDMRRITPECFNTSRTQFATTQKKTGRRAFVNLHTIPMSEEITRNILRKYDYYAPYTGSTNNFNATLHELLGLIGGRFHETIRIENKVNGRLVTEDVRLCDCITSHCGRRTGITAAICSGINTPRVMRASGHSDYRTFEEYIRRSVDDVND